MDLLEDGMRVINNKLAVSHKKKFYRRHKGKNWYVPFEVARDIAYEKGLSNQDLEAYLETTGPTDWECVWFDQSR